MAQLESCLHHLESLHRLVRGLIRSHPGVIQSEMNAERQSATTLALLWIWCTSVVNSKM